jgi:hypothetical protein
MAKWEIRFQRFALSFRPSALDVCCFRLSLAFLAHHSPAIRDDGGSLPCRAKVQRRREPLAFQPLPLAIADAFVAVFRHFSDREKFVEIYWQGY